MCVCVCACVCACVRANSAYTRARARTWRAHARAPRMAFDGRARRAPVSRARARIHTLARACAPLRTPRARTHTPLAHHGRRRPRLLQGHRRPQGGARQGHHGRPGGAYTHTRARAHTHTHTHTHARARSARAVCPNPQSARARPTRGFEMHPNLIFACVLGTSVAVWHANGVVWRDLGILSARAPGRVCVCAGVRAGVRGGAGRGGGEGGRGGALVARPASLRCSPPPPCARSWAIARESPPRARAEAHARACACARVCVRAVALEAGGCRICARAPARARAMVADTPFAVAAPRPRRTRPPRSPPAPPPRCCSPPPRRWPAATSSSARTRARSSSTLPPSPSARCDSSRRSPCRAHARRTRAVDRMHTCMRACAASAYARTLVPRSRC